MATDRLSDILDLIEVRSVVSGGSAVRGRWQTRNNIDDDLKFIAVVRGRARLTTDGLPAPLELNAGDVVILNGRSWLALEGGVGDGEPIQVRPPSAGSVMSAEDANADGADVLIGGRVDLNPTGRELLLRTLPPVLHVGLASPVGAALRGHIQRLFEEIMADRVGSDFAIRQYGQLLLLDLIRGYLHDPDMPAGWLKVLTDERLRPALALIHEQPAKSWSLEDLARAASMSRTTFAGRFRDAAGTPPLSYLINWRMLLAQRELRTSDTQIRALALQVGYSSESAFSTAFKRRVGESPLSYRSRARTPQVSVAT
ncbi:MULTISPECIES: AraC family transcriptional regulator [Cryobacterium]|uniref:AraC family transcriptional regulator n=1 Tax=Cryobacterium zongtaii TaxID=1259217 RepID=A0A2S3ZGV6_9MICO|nr:MULTISPECIES: AraC family transcriptional regulator [Cryobacterium]POH63678.1 AraC family transcriptional regulator [Cryobacterium zongtaii]POH66617.1 AraC family transcriptional regulator [Cryobacterium zongtaii]TFC40810.1 AraC family transcriptional regulator [Cryobacterium sp. TMN-39-2]